jgi:hypothetical protein
MIRLIGAESEHPEAPINQPNTILKATKFAKTAN